MFVCLFVFYQVNVHELIELCLGQLRKNYGTFQKLRVWVVFIVSDIVSLCIWWKFWGLLKVMSKIPLEAYENGQFPKTVGNEVLADVISSHRDWILGLTITYAILIVGRIVASALPSRNAADIHKDIV